MIKRIITTIGKQPLYQSFYKFGGGAHHEIDYQAVVTKSEKSGYFLNPNEVARRITRLIAHFQAAKNVEKMTLNTQWWQLGLNELDYTQLTVIIQQQFQIEFPDDAAQKFKDISDMVQFVSRSFWAN